MDYVDRWLIRLMIRKNLNLFREQRCSDYMGSGHWVLTKFSDRCDCSTLNKFIMPMELDCFTELYQIDQSAMVTKTYWFERNTGPSDCGML